MWRLTELMVRSTLVTAWRLATSPTRISPDLLKATTDGVVREAFGVHDNGGLATFKSCDAGIGSTQIDANCASHIWSPLQ